MRLRKIDAERGADIDEVTIADQYFNSPFVDRRIPIRSMIAFIRAPVAEGGLESTFDLNRPGERQKWKRLMSIVAQRFREAKP